MGDMNEHPPVKLVISAIYRDESTLGRALGEVERAFGPFDVPELTLPFDKTDYYCSEMGRPLKRTLRSFVFPVPCDGIARFKILSNGIENLFMEGACRRVNIDPGYITPAKLVLLTTKDHAHRIYLDDGIFAENTLYFSKGYFNPWPWTYPDYASSPIREFFEKVRDLHLRQLRSGSGETACS